MANFTIIAIVLVGFFQMLVLSLNPRKAFTSSIFVALLVFIIATIGIGVYSSANHPGDGVAALEQWLQHTYIALSYLMIDILIITAAVITIGLIKEHFERIASTVTKLFGKEYIPLRQSSQPAEVRQIAHQLVDVNGPALRARIGYVSTAPTRKFDPLDDDTFNILIDGNVNETMLSYVKTMCERAMVSDLQHVRIDINTGGGCFDTSYQIREIIASLATRKSVIIRVVGICMSGGVSILCAVPIAQRYAMEHARFMVHTAANDRGTRNPQVDICNTQLIKDLLAETGISEASLRRLMKSRRNYFFSAQDAVKLGIVGAIS